MWTPYVVSYNVSSVRFSRMVFRCFTFTAQSASRGGRDRTAAGHSSKILHESSRTHFRYKCSVDPHRGWRNLEDMKASRKQCSTSTKRQLTDELEEISSYGK